MTRVTRRQFNRMSAAATSMLLGACRAIGVSARSDGRLAARPRTGAPTAATPGRLGLEPDRDATLQLPSTAPTGRLPLLVFLHGATQRADGMLRRIGEAMDAAGIAILAPDSRETTWDAIRGDFGPDIDFINRALQRTFDTVAVDPQRIAIGGFSDGATYALSLGLINGDLFTHVMALSPGFVISGEPHGKPRVFVAHGQNDQILPIDSCSRVIVPALRRRGYAVAFREFGGRHEMPPDVQAEAARWFVDSGR